MFDDVEVLIEEGSDGGKVKDVEDDFYVAGG
jgi:hypothetical protein